MDVQDEQPTKVAERSAGKASKVPILIVIAAPITGILFWILLVTLAPLFLK
jgi:hypothetical protein